MIRLRRLKGLKRAIAFIFCLTLLASMSGVNMGYAAKKESFDTWQDVAIAMGKEFDEAMSEVLADDYKGAYSEINQAYFGYYEVQGFEKNVMVSISSDRVNEIEGQFSRVKHMLLGNEDASRDDILKHIELLKMKVYKDAMVLDGAAYKSDADEVGAIIFGKDGPTYLELEAQEATSESDAEVAQGNTSQGDAGEASDPVKPIQVDPSQRNWTSFATAFGLLLREGLEALLVVVAIIAYLIKTGNKHLTKNVFYGVGAAVVCSILLAVIIEWILGGTGVAQELIEGWTMFLAVLVLFYVSNWMLHKSETEAWEKYINEKVQYSIDSRSKNTLVFAAFIAVFREGAELILFFKASFSAGMNSPAYIAMGIVAATVVLVLVYVAYRYLSFKIPLGIFFKATSVLLFLMCISFMGKGVVELTEANVISGRTVIPAMKGFSIGILNIYDRAETLIPQVMLAIASLYLMLKHTVFAKKDFNR